jgi:hypothetical protein
MRRAKHIFRLTVNGKLIEAVTIAGLALIVGKSKDSILSYEKKGIFPSAPLVSNGVRYYPIRLAKGLVPIVNKFDGARRPSDNLIVEINKLFKKEVDHATSKDEEVG